MGYDVTPEDQRSLDFLLRSGTPGTPVGQFLGMADQRSGAEKPSSVADRFSMHGQMNPRVQALLTRLAQMRRPTQATDIAGSGF